MSVILYKLAKYTMSQIDPIHIADEPPPLQPAPPEQHAQLIDNVFGEYLQDYNDDKNHKSNEYFDQSKEEQKHTIDSINSNTQLLQYKTFTLLDRALDAFVDGLSKDLDLTSDQIFDWYEYFQNPEPVIPEEALFRLYFDLPSFSIQYALLCIRSHCTGRPTVAPQSAYTFNNIIQNSSARTQLIALISPIWNQLGTLRGAKYIQKQVLANVHRQCSSLLHWFGNYSYFPSDISSWPERVFPFENTQQQPEYKSTRTPAENLLMLVAQACFIRYAEAFRAPITDPTDFAVLQHFQGSVANCAQTAFSVILNGIAQASQRDSTFYLKEDKKQVVMNKLISMQHTRVLFARVIANYFAEQQVLKATAAMNKEIAKIRYEDTTNCLAMIVASFVQ